MSAENAAALPPPFIAVKESSLGGCPSCGRDVRALEGQNFAALTHDLPPCKLFEALEADDFVRHMRQQRMPGKRARA